MSGIGGNQVAYCFNSFLFLFLHFTFLFLHFTFLDYFNILSLSRSKTLEDSPLALVYLALVSSNFSP